MAVVMCWFGAFMHVPQSRDFTDQRPHQLNNGIKFVDGKDQIHSVIIPDIDN